MNMIYLRYHIPSDDSPHLTELTDQNVIAFTVGEILGLLNSLVENLIDLLVLVISVGV